MTQSPDPETLQPPGLVRLPSPLERLALRMSTWPWWAIVLVVGLILIFYGILTTPIYRLAFTYVTDNPVLSATDFLKVTYRVDLNGQLTVVSGALTAQDSQTLTVRTDDAKIVNVAVARVDTVTQQNGQSVIHLPAQPISGIFYTETATQYNIKQADNSIISVTKTDVEKSRQFNPPKCNADINGSCQISVVLPEQTVTGLIVSKTDTDYAVQTAPAQYVTFPRSAIKVVISEFPGQCALNNLASCQTGPFLTLFLTLTSYILALIIGMTLALMRISSNVIFRNFAILYIEVIRGIPILVILLIFYFAIGPALRDALNIPLSGTTRAILGLGVAYGAFLAEIFRAGIQSISRGQMEAARSLGMSYFQAMRTVILPQAIRVVLPPLGNDFIAMLKDTSLVTAISLAELTFLSNQFLARYEVAFPPFITIAAIYLVMTLSLSVVVRTIEHRMRLPGAAFQ